MISVPRYNSQQPQMKKYLSKVAPKYQKLSFKPLGKNLKIWRPKLLFF